MSCAKRDLETSRSKARFLSRFNKSGERDIPDDFAFSVSGIFTLAMPNSSQ